MIVIHLTNLQIVLDIIFFSLGKSQIQLKVKDAKNHRDSRKLKGIILFLYNIAKHYKIVKNYKSQNHKNYRTSIHCYSSATLGVLLFSTLLEQNCKMNFIFTKYVSLSESKYFISK